MHDGEANVNKPEAYKYTTVNTTTNKAMCEREHAHRE